MKAPTFPVNTAHYSYYALQVNNYLILKQPIIIYNTRVIGTKDTIK